MVVSIQVFGTKVYYYRFKGKVATTGATSHSELHPNTPQEAVLEVHRHTCAIRSVAKPPKEGEVIELQHYRRHQSVLEEGINATQVQVPTATSYQDG